MRHRFTRRIEAARRSALGCRHNTLYSLPTLNPTSLWHFAVAMLGMSVGYTLFATGYLPF
ncbi:hypothetical protein [Leptolyngbya sp. KIOST-1]|uniref:hypothetical protein n=1 Tax=Leptolyngbya sp. KIOST-1 TaxID=1229172 RepID=UPI0012E09AC7|nr:hypothetical protein [Leptolyngbya sp. KIOST-1]